MRGTQHDGTRPPQVAAPGHSHRPTRAHCAVLPRASQAVRVG